jgi:hypothetical protein
MKPRGAAMQESLRGTERTWRDVCLESAFWGEAEFGFSGPSSPLMTLSGHSRDRFVVALNTAAG